MSEITSNSGIHIYLSDLNKNIGGLTDLAKKRHGSADLHTPIYPPPKRLEVAESYSFHRCFQEENETVSVYSARLRHLASTCNFGEFLNRSLRDQFVCGIRNPATRKNLLSEDRTFQQALEVAIADEIAAKESVQVQQRVGKGGGGVVHGSQELKSKIYGSRELKQTSHESRTIQRLL